MSNYNRTDDPQWSDRCLRDVVALSTLPSIWCGAEPLRVAESLAAALFTTLRPEFVYVSIQVTRDRPPIEVAQTDRFETNATLAEQVGAQIVDWARAHDPDELLVLSSPDDSNNLLRVSTRSLGLQGELGAIAAGFTEDGPPTPFHHLILNVAASQAATAILNLRLMESLRESEERTRLVNAELDDRIAALEQLTDELQDSRRAALNLMEDTVQSRELVEALNRKLSREVEDRKEKEEALRQRTAQFETLLQRAPIGVFLVDAEFCVRDVNPTALRVFGDVPDLIGRDFASVMRLLARRENAEETIRIFRHTLETGESFHTPEYVQHRIDRDATEYYEWRADRIPLPDGRHGVVCYFRDISDQIRDRRAIADSEERFRTLADNIAQLAWMADDEGSIFWYNRRWFEFTGTTLEEVQGWGWQSVHHPDHVQRVVEKVRRHWASGEVWEDTFPLRGKDGAYRWFLSRALPVRDKSGKIVRWFGTNTDITEQRAAEEALKEADRRKNEFLATLAHELRNPLAPICMGLELMKMGSDDAAALDETRSMMERQTQQMVRLIDDLLDVSRITRGKLKLRKKRVELGDVIRNAVDATRPLIDQAGHLLTVEAPESSIAMHADPHRLAQVLSNLLNNAAKYTPNGGRIWLKAERQGTSVLVTVKDTGMGIPRERCEDIFEMFTQIDRPVEMAFTGLGIGLTLVKSLVRMHGGTIEVKSEGPNQGSEFRMRLPILVESLVGKEEPVAGSTTTDVTGLRVLIVDDSKAAVDMLAMVIRRLGNDVQTAYDGLEAIAKAAEFLPDAIVMDIGMPKMNGYVAAQQIRKQAWSNGVLLVALTGWGQEDDKRRTREAGFDYHLVKPPDPGELRRILSEAAAKQTEPHRKRVMGPSAE